MEPDNPVRPALRDLFHHVLVLATALAVKGDSHSRQVVSLVRGLIIQVAFRTVSRQALVIPGRAVLLWSVVAGRASQPSLRRSHGVRYGLATVAATCLGTVVTGLPLALLMPLRDGLQLLGMSTRLATLVVLGCAAASLLLMGHGAFGAFRLERHRARRMTTGLAEAVWRLDLLGAPDSGRGHGGRLLDAFLCRADEAGAHVFLVTQTDNVGFYARHGLQVRSPAEPDGMIIMCRAPGASQARQPPASTVSNPSTVSPPTSACVSSRRSRRTRADGTRRRNPASG
jgi:hypothetical protein